MKNSSKTKTNVKLNPKTKTSQKQKTNKQKLKNNINNENNIIELTNNRNKNIIIFILALMTIILLSSIIYLVKVFNFRINNIKQSIIELQYNIINENKYSTQKNSLEKLHLQNSSISDDQGTHPKVLYFNEGLFGYKFWMAYTPYPKANDMYENPNILVSDDGVTWVEPNGFINPLEAIPENYKKTIIYNSDTHLVYNYTTKELECWWRFVNDENGNLTIYRKVTKDGINWSPKQEIITDIRKQRDILCPAIIYENNVYKIWYVDSRYRVSYIKSKDLKNWSEPVIININYNDKDIRNWHLDVINDEGKYIMVICSFIKDSPRTRMNLYYSISENETEFEEAKLLLTPTTSSNKWDSKGLYRSSIVKVNNDYYLYYSAIATNEERGIGLIKARSIEELAIMK